MTGMMGTEKFTDLSGLFANTWEMIAQCRGRVAGYLRVSTTAQTHERQAEAMKELGVKAEDMFFDKQSGKDFERPGYKEMLGQLREGDLLVIKNLDRLGRNTAEVKEQWRILTKEKGISIAVIDTPILNAGKELGPLGQAVSDIIFTIFSLIADFDRQSIYQRMHEGMLVAMRERGIRPGRKALGIPKSFWAVKGAYESGGISQRAAALALGVDRKTFKKWMHEAETKTGCQTGQLEQQADTQAGTEAERQRKRQADAQAGAEAADPRSRTKAGVQAEAEAGKTVETGAALEESSGSGAAAQPDGSTTTKDATARNAAMERIGGEADNGAKETGGACAFQGDTPRNGGKESTGAKNIGMENFRTKNTGVENAKTRNTEMKNTGAENAGIENAETKNTGAGNAKAENTGMENARIETARRTKKAGVGNTKTDSAGTSRKDMQATVQGSSGAEKCRAAQDATVHILEKCGNTGNTEGQGGSSSSIPHKIRVPLLM